jgi:hypothetical protein
VSSVHQLLLAAILPAGIAFVLGEVNLEIDIRGIVYKEYFLLASLAYCVKNHTPLLSPASLLYCALYTISYGITGILHDEYLDLRIAFVLGRENCLCAAGNGRKHDENKNEY